MMIDIKSISNLGILRFAHFMNRLREFISYFPICRHGTPSSGKSESKHFAKFLALKQKAMRWNEQHDLRQKFHSFHKFADKKLFKMNNQLENFFILLNILHSFFTIIPWYIKIKLQGRYQNGFDIPSFLFYGSFTSSTRWEFSAYFSNRNSTCRPIWLEE